MCILVHFFLSCHLSRLLNPWSNCSSAWLVQFLAMFWCCFDQLHALEDKVNHKKFFPQWSVRLAYWQFTMFQYSCSLLSGWLYSLVTPVVSSVFLTHLFGYNCVFSLKKESTPYKHPPWEGTRSHVEPLSWSLMIDSRKIPHKGPPLEVTQSLVEPTKLW